MWGNEEAAVAKHSANKQIIDTGTQVATDWGWHKPAAIYMSLSNQAVICLALDAQRITHDLVIGKKVSLVSVPEWIQKSFHLFVTLAVYRHSHSHRMYATRADALSWGRALPLAGM